MAREFATALVQAERVVRMESGFHWGYFFAGWSLEQLGRHSEAVTALEEAVRVSSDSPVMMGGLGQALAANQDRRAAQRVIRHLEQLRGDKGLFAYEIAVILCTLGERDDALTWLRRAVRERSGWIPYSRVDPRLATLHADPRFEALFLRDERTQTDIGVAPSS
jgi:Flp pilus assembly protein TadD